MNLIPIPKLPSIYSLRGLPLPPEKLIEDDYYVRYLHDLAGRGISVDEVSNYNSLETCHIVHHVTAAPHVHQRPPIVVLPLSTAFRP
jgi:hypothetical protein